ncbi:Fc.00g003540.m01.CDS01 [Cosmosporella sp. VM-42]
MSVSNTRRADLQAATDSLTAAVGEFTAGPDVDDKGQRQKIIEAAEKIISVAKDPSDQGMDAIGQLTLIAANRIFWEWGVFDEIPPEGSISYSDLAGKVNADVSVLTRIAGVIVSKGILEQIGADQVSHTPRSRIFTKNEPAGLIYAMAWENGLIPFSHLPRYFETYGRKEPQQENHVPVTFAVNSPESTFWEVLIADQPRMKRFMGAMGPLEDSMPIAGIYDFSWAVDKAKESPESERIIFVDVGGGKGHAIKAIHQEFPDLPLNRCLLQDRPEVIEAVATLNDPKLSHVQKQAIDFHLEQPSKGALIYWIRRCLHNYGDSVSVSILKHLAASMAEDSRVLIQEDIASNPPHYKTAMVDMMMMNFGGKSRTLECWERVVNEAGLQISSVSAGQGPWKSLVVLECVKKAT